MLQNKNGVITFKDLRRVFGTFCGDNEINNLMLEADINGDGEITFAEFKQLMTNFKTTKKIKSLWSM